MAGKIITSLKYRIDIIEPDSLSLGELGGGLVLKKLKK